MSERAPRGWWLGAAVCCAIALLTALVAVFEPLITGRPVDGAAEAAIWKGLLMGLPAVIVVTAAAYRRR